MNIKRFFGAIAILATICFQSCVSPKDLAYFQESKNRDTTKQQLLNESYEAIIQPNDILAIYVSSLSPEASSFFNPAYETNQGTTGAGVSTPIALGYLVDVNGNVELPLIGTIKVAGLTTQQAREALKTKLEKYLQSPTVRLYFQNYRVTVLGEVNKPGVYNVPNEKMTLVELIGLAGDLTVYANREKILIIRETEGKKEYKTVNIRDRSIFNSKELFLHPNDIVYIEAGKAKAAQSDIFYRWVPIFVSLVTLFTIVDVRLLR